MAEFPALPLWTDALIGDTYHLTPAQFGAYMRLLIAAWRRPNCDLPDDDRFLGRVVGDQRGWHRLKPIVMPFFDQSDDGFYRQKRLLAERNWCATKAAKNAAAGRTSALKRKNRGSTNVPTKLERKSNPHTHTHTQTHKVGKDLVGNTESESEDRSPDGKIAVSPKRNGHDQVEAAFDAWNAFAQTHGLPTVQQRTTARRAALRRRLADGGGLDGWQAALDKAASIPWMLGENPRGWRLNLTTLVREEFFAKLMEGAYDKATGLSAAQAWLAKQSAP